MLLCDPMGAATMVACIHAKGHRFFDSDKLFERHLDLAKQIDVEDCPGVQMSQGSRARVLA